VEDFLEASLRAFAARRFCLDAESADIMLLSDMYRLELGGRGVESEEKRRGTMQ
jgi:hypothetical protein